MSDPASAGWRASAKAAASSSIRRDAGRSREDIVEAVRFALRRHARAVPSADVVASYVGDGARLLVARSLGVTANDASVSPVLETFVEFYEAHPVDHTKFMPGALDALDALRGVPIALCTNKPRHHRAPRSRRTRRAARE